MSAENFKTIVEEILDMKPFRLAPGGLPIWFDYEIVNHFFPATAVTPTGTRVP
jgi:hypothetical protein